MIIICFQMEVSQSSLMVIKNVWLLGREFTPEKFQVLMLSLGLLNNKQKIHKRPEYLEINLFFIFSLSSILMGWLVATIELILMELT
jgi:hypothetical protein